MSCIENKYLKGSLCLSECGDEYIENRVSGVC